MSLMISHFSHHHQLALRCSQWPFQCDGCKEQGIGACYKCEHPNCSFFLHDVCAEASPTASHTFFSYITFNFHSNPSNSLIVPCHACGNDINGFHYSSPVPKDLDIPHSFLPKFHPVCLKLKHLLQNDDGLTLHLREKVSFSRFHMSSILRKKCQHCDSTEVSRLIKGWAYVSSDGSYRYHVACVRDMMYDKWKMSYFQGNIIGSITDHGDSLLSLIPSNNSSSSSSKFLKMANIVLRLIVSAIFGEPTGYLYAAAEIFRKN